MRARAVILLLSATVLLGAGEAPKEDPDVARLLESMRERVRVKRLILAVRYRADHR